MIPDEYIELKRKKFNITKFKQTIRSLLYLGICTRSDIQLAVNKASRKSNKPTYEDWNNLLKVFRYLIVNLWSKIYKEYSIQH